MFWKRKRPLDLITEVKKLSPKPGDILIFKATNIPPDRIEEVRDSLKDILPESIRGVLLVGDQDVVITSFADIENKRSEP